MASTQSTGSDAGGKGRYQFSFSWESPYGHAIVLLERIGPPVGLVLDIGCGYAAIAEPLTNRGFDYCGIDIEADAVKSVADRGHEAHVLDVSATDELPARLRDILGGRSVSAMFALDVLEHLTDPRTFLTALRASLQPTSTPLLIVSVPNVAHADVGAKLVFGRWDYTPTGLLDRTHVSFFTGGQLQSEARASGFLEVGAHDFELPYSDQRFPADHPALCEKSPVAQLLRIWRAAADPHGGTNQFIRAFVPTDLDAASQNGTVGHVGAETPAWRLSVVMRTQGRRAQGLREALTCLAAQTFDSFNVHLMVHTADDTAVTAVRGLVDEFHPSFSSRVGVVHVPTGGGRSRPLNQALNQVRSEYVAFLDDDDLITADWAQAFCEGADGCSVVRSQSAVRNIGPASDPSAPYMVKSGLEFPYDASFDLTRHLWTNQTPICSYAVPRSLIETLNLRFDEEFSVLEDWEFLLRCASFAGIRDTGKLTSIVQLWLEGDSSRAAHSPELWKSLERVLQERLNERPFLLGPGSVLPLVALHRRRAELEAALPPALARSRELERLRSELDELSRAYRTVVESKRWRVLGPPARTVATIRRLRARRATRSRASA